MTASIYCDRSLDAVLREVIYSHSAYVAECCTGPWMLWFVRYSRGGDHVKLRLHGPPAEAEQIRDDLSRRVGEFFASLPPAGVEPRVSRPGAPPIDADDESEADHPDRSLRWTQYRRSHVSLGPRPFLDDDRYAELMAAALSGAAGLSLSAARAAGADGIAAAAGQRVLLKALVAGLAAAGFAPEHCARYLAYHRDWLLRFFAEDCQKEDEARAGLGRQAATNAATVRQLAGVVAAEWMEAAPAVDAAGFAGAAARLVEYLAGFRGNPAYDVDPFAGDEVFPPLFKVFHGLANQLGLAPANEALVHHLLISATGLVAGEQLAAAVGV
ncbi:lantibiotic dehydratase C-terminal domain-containing protein [Longimicrobium sp.]|uniref:lantibiotic dehydratase C-terminal domain-containing protein n=1 Tax=Longimicrobium sp. TaxID=2029185 RepID=UPI002EDB586E